MINNNYHEYALESCLLSWRFPNSEIDPISNDSDEMSFYAANKGIITIQIEGQNAHLFVPEIITPSQNKTFDDDLSIILNQEVKTNTRMNFLRLVLPNRHNIIKQNTEDPNDPKPFFAEEISNVLKSLGILKDEVVEENTSSIRIS